MTWVDYVTALLFFSMGAMYIFISLKNKTDVVEENFIVSSFAVAGVAFCFIFAHLGFINTLLEVLVIWPYVFLSYAGTKTSLRLIYRAHGGKKETFNWLNNFYVLLTTSFFAIELIVLGAGELLRNNYLVMSSNLIVPIYLLLLVVANGYALIKENRFFIDTVFTNYTLISFTISIYEFLDFIVFCFDNYKYKTFGIYYEDPTHIFDLFWILGNVTIFLFIPRMAMTLREMKNVKKGLK